MYLIESHPLIRRGDRRVDTGWPEEAGQESWSVGLEATQTHR